MRGVRGALGAMLCIAMVAGSPVAAQSGNVSLSHHRLVFDEGTRTATLYIVNRGDTAVTYRVDMIEMEMNADGAITPLGDQVPDTSASAFVDFTPRRIALAPRQSQAIKVRARVPASPGERRSHLAITAQPADDAGFSPAEIARVNPSSISVRVSSLFSVSIPIILRTGVDAAGVTIESLHMVRARPEERPVLAFDLVRQGDGSVYGDVEIVAGSGKNREVLESIRGIAVYPEIARRSVRVSLPEDSVGRTVRVVYRNRENVAGNELAATALSVP
ncbi:hypothetical protein [Croceicoccus sp. YJ47]|uniref:hypothetical protein n=1 Tax=Croceicoccus sp. YJ47 TaxID=2798724 RepID=UPI001923D418|nr:hypothetical protein [Croceicoccus sp. YJ47]QQN73725.1 hypothetical protein JD971_13210 [Croceicoccus sp. YJ47]